MQQTLICTKSCSCCSLVKASWSLHKGTVLMSGVFKREANKRDVRWALLGFRLHVFDAEVEDRHQVRVARIIGHAHALHVFQGLSGGRDSQRERGVRAQTTGSDSLGRKS